MTPLDIACRFSSQGINCGAEAGEPCRNAETFHACRIEDAAAMSFVADPVDETTFDAIVAKRLF